MSAGSSDLQAVHKFVGAIEAEQVFIRQKHFNWSKYLTLGLNYTNIDLKVEHIGFEVRVRGSLGLWNTGGANSTSGGGWITVASFSNAPTTVRGQTALAPLQLVPSTSSTSGNAGLSYGYGTAFIAHGCTSGADLLGAATAATLEYALTNTTHVIGAKMVPCRLVVDSSTYTTFDIQVFIPADYEIIGSTATGTYNGSSVGPASPNVQTVSTAPPTGGAALAKIIICDLKWSGLPLLAPDSL